MRSVDARTTAVLNLVEVIYVNVGSHILNLVDGRDRILNLVDTSTGTCTGAEVLDPSIVLLVPYWVLVQSRAPCRILHATLVLGVPVA